MSTVLSATERLHADYVADQHAGRGHLTQLDRTMERLRHDLVRDREATVVRLAEIDSAVGQLRKHVTGESADSHARLAEIDSMIGTLREQGISARATLSERLGKLELLLEHPDVLGLSQNANCWPSPTVSVVMPTWNRGWVVGAAIRSVQAQAFSDWELLVVDDGSSDETPEIMEAFKHDQRIRYIIQTHAGQCRARNHGLELARGALIAYLDSDNVWYPEYLAAAVAVFSTKPDADCLYGAMVTDAHWEGEHILFRSFDRAALIANNYIGISTFMHRRQLIDRYGRFDEELDSLEDWDLILRYTTHAPAYRLPALAVRYRAMDQTRLSVTTRPESAAARIRAKWRQS